MTRVETIAVLALLKAAYPNFYKGMPQTDLQAVVNLWSLHFAGEDADTVTAAVHTLISSRTEGYPPTIGAVKEQIDNLTAKDALSETEAWAMVSKAARNGLYGYREEFEKLPEPVKKAVGTPEQLRAWAMMPADEVESVVASNFRRSYRDNARREKENRLLPLIGGGFSMLSGNGSAGNSGLSTAKKNGIVMPKGSVSDD